MIRALFIPVAIGVWRTAVEAVDDDPETRALARSAHVLRLCQLARFTGIVSPAH